MEWSRRRAGAAAGVLSAAPVLGAAAATDVSTVPSEPPVAGPVRAASGTVSVFPSRGTPAASPATQVSLRGVDEGTLGPTDVDGPVTGASPGVTVIGAKNGFGWKGPVLVDDDGGAVVPTALALPAGGGAAR